MEFLESHTTEACPLNNSSTAKMVLQTENVRSRQNCTKIQNL